MPAFQYWLLACRPKTLLISLTPLLVGGMLAYTESGNFHWLPWLAALLAAMTIQIGTNLHNDASDFERGTDRSNRLGPRRASAEGWLSATSIKRAAGLSFALAFSLGIYLVWLGGWPILFLGLCALASGYAYTGGPRPIAYSPLGELFVLAFFGIAAVGGSYYLQTLALSWPVFLAGIAIGLPAAAVLTVNNYRDLETDTEAGRHTLVSIIGRPATRWLYGLMLLLPPLLLAPLIGDSIARWLPGLALPMAAYLIRRIWVLPIGRGLNQLLAATAQYQLLCGALFCLAVLA